MAKVNIPTSNTDPNYRYKMDRVQTKIEGSGNGIKTNVVNMAAVASALKRHPAYVTKFFGMELGALSKWEDKEERAIVNGAHQAKAMQDLLDKFIDSYVLCPNCNLPEIDMNVKKEIISGRCKACGWKGDLDNQHRLSTFIAKNPPDSLTGRSSGVAEKKDRKARQAERAAKAKAKDEDDEDEAEEKKKKKKKKKKDEADDDDEAKEKKKKKKKKKKKTSDDDDDDDDDGRKEKKSKRRSSKQAASDSSENANGRSVSEDEDDDEELTFESELIQGVADRLRSTFEEQPNMTPTELWEESRLLQISQSFDQKLRVFVFLKALYNGNISAETISSKVAFMQKITADKVLSTEVMMEAFEVSVKQAGSIDKYPYILKALYDSDLLTEETILEHYEKATGGPAFLDAKAAGKPFLDWLKSEDDDETESDEED